MATRHHHGKYTLRADWRRPQEPLNIAHLQVAAYYTEARSGQARGGVSRVVHNLRVTSTNSETNWNCSEKQMLLCVAKVSTMACC